MEQHGKCTCPVHDKPPPLSGRRSVGVMIRSPQKQMKDQAVQTSVESDINYFQRTQIGMDRCESEGAESILLETEISDYNIQAIYLTPNDKQGFAINTEEEVLLEISSSQEFNERQASVNLTPRNYTISETRQGHNDETEKNESTSLEMELIRDKHSEIYETFNYQCDLVIDMEAEAPKQNVLSPYFSVELENDIASGLHSEASTQETQITRGELPIIYEIPHYQSDVIIKDGGKHSSIAESCKLLKINHYMNSLPHEDFVLSTQNVSASSQVERSEIRLLQHELNHYELPKFYDKCFLITEVGTEDMSFEKVNLLDFKGLPNFVNSLSQEYHVLETKLIYCGSPVVTGNSSLLEMEISRVEFPRPYARNQRPIDTDIRTEDETPLGPTRPPRLNEVLHNFIYNPQKDDSRETHSNLDVVKAQSADAMLLEMEYPSNEVAGVPVPTYQSDIETTEDKEELLHIERRDLEEINDFPFSVNLVQQTDFSTQPIDLNLILDNGKFPSTETSSRRVNDSVECIDCTSQADGQITTTARRSIMEPEICYKRNFTSHDAIVDTKQVNSETEIEYMSTNSQIQCDSNMNKMKLNFKRTDNVSVDKFKHLNDLHNSDHIAEKKLPAHKELAQKSTKINFLGQFTDKGSKKVPSNIRKIEAIPYLQETWRPSVQVKQNRNRTVNQTSRDAFPSFIVTKTPQVSSPYTSSVKVAHSNKRHISYADVPSHGGVFLVGKENVAIFSQNRVSVSRPARPPVRHGELSWESDLPVSAANDTVYVSSRAPIAPTITSSQFYQSQYSSIIRTVRKSQTNVLPSQTATYLPNNEQSMRIDMLAYSSHYKQSQNTTADSTTRNFKTDDSMLEKTTSRQQETTHPALVRPPGELTRVPRQFSAPTSNSRLTLGVRHDFNAPCRYCCHCKHFHSRGPCSSGASCICMMHEHYPYHYMTEHIVRNFFMWPAIVTFFTGKINDFQCNIFKFWKSFNFSSQGNIGKLSSPLDISDVDESCRCTDKCHFISSTKDSHACTCKECAKRTHENPFQVDKAIQMPPVENTAVQTDLDVRDVPVTERVSEAGHSLPSLTVSAEDQSIQHAASSAGDESASGAQCQLQIVLPAQQCVGTPRSVHVQDFRIVLLSSSDVTERHAIHDEHLRTIEHREHGELMKYQRQQQKWHVWMFYIITAVVLATVLLCLTIFLYQSGRTSSSHVVGDRLFTAIICSACALVIVLAYYIVWPGFYFDKCRGHKIVAGVSTAGLVVFLVLGVLALLDLAAPVFVALIFLLAAVFLVACAHSAVVLYRNWPCTSPPAAANLTTQTHPAPSPPLPLPLSSTKQ